MANAWGLSWGNPSAWGVSWGDDGVAPVAPVTTYQDPGFWTEEHRKIKEATESPQPTPPITALSSIPAIIAPPKAFDDHDEIEELLELMEILDADRSLSQW
jgi:hypothetical protein